VFEETFASLDDPLPLSAIVISVAMAFPALKKAVIINIRKKYAILVVSF
jgi:hypothetical protein